MAKPATIPEWATNANYSTGEYAGLPTKVAPSAGVRADGHIPKTAPGPQHENHDRNSIGKWLTYVDGLPSDPDFTGERFDWGGEHHFEDNVFLHGGLIQWESLPVGLESLIQIRHFSGVDCTFDQTEFKPVGTSLQIAAGASGGTALWHLNGRLANTSILTEAVLTYTWSAGTGTATFFVYSTLPDGTDPVTHETVAVNHGGSPKTLTVSPAVQCAFNDRLYYLGLSTAAPSGENLNVKSVKVTTVPLYLIP